MKDFLQWPLQLLPRLNTAGRFPLDDDSHHVTYRSTHTHALHLHDYPATLRIAHREIPLAPGDLTLTPINIPSSYALPSPGHHWCIHFSPAAHRKKRPANSARLPLHLPLGIHATFAVERFRRISSLFARSRAAESDPLAATSASLLLQELLLWIADLHQSKSHSPTLVPKIQPALDRVVSILQARFTENLSVPALADEVELSQNYLARAFRKRFRTTIPHYLVARRVEHACYLLASTDMPIHRVGQRVGMPDPQHFNKQFRRLTGESPSRHRASQNRTRSVSEGSPAHSPKPHPQRYHLAVGKVFNIPVRK